ncbi:MAG: SDR family NAD(P)-dependent oxidoreductase [Candidatus Pelagibacter sp.]
MKKTIVISGVSKGLGAAICRKILGKGWIVAGFSRSSNQEIKNLQKKYKKNFFFEKFDVTNFRKIESFIKKAQSRGKIYGLINNAGVVDEDLIARQNKKAIKNLVNINLLGPIYLSSEVIKYLMINGEGRIINISSVVAKSGYKGTAVYSSTKSALNGFTRALSRELGSRNITVNAVSPGFMETNLTKNMSKDKLRQIIRRTPIGRVGKVTDMLGLISFLLSKEASFISGQIILVDGGLSA